MKKLVSLFLCLAALVCASAALALEHGDFSYDVLPDGSAAITGYAGSEASLTFPSELDGRPVTAIADFAYIPSREITSVYIPRSITTVGLNSFAETVCLVRFDVEPEHPTLDTMAGVLFDKTSAALLVYPRGRGLSEYAVPRGVKRIAPSAFFGCESLTSLTVPDTVTEIGRCAFIGCSGLTSVVLPDGLTTLSDGLFSDCPSLTTLTIPDSVTRIERDAFCYCEQLSSLTLPEGVTYIGEGAFFDCPALTELAIPAGVSFIGEDAFVTYGSFTALVVPGSYAEQYCIENDIACRPAVR